MYQSHFQLSDRPFASAPNPEHYYPAASIEQAREVTALNIERASGASIVMGPVGCGKTLLCQLLASHFENELPVCLLTGDSLQERDELLRALLHGLGLPWHGLAQSDLRTTLTEHMTSQGCRDGILLLVDDADRMPEDLFEELRVLSNIVKDGRPCVRLVLAGSHSLDECVSNPRLESLSQRIVGRLYLEHFSREETADYILARINASGGDANLIFPADAWERVFLATNGVPRLVNQICDHALLMASTMNATTVDGDTVEAAWADLQQLPTPKSQPVETTQDSDSDIVEFGSLEDDESGQVPDGVSGVANDAVEAQESFDSTSESLPDSIDIVSEDADSGQIEQIQSEVNELSDAFRELAVGQTDSGTSEIVVSSGDAAPFDEAITTDDAIDIDEAQNETVYESQGSGDGDFSHGFPPSSLAEEEEFAIDEAAGPVDLHSPFADEQYMTPETPAATGDNASEVAALAATTTAVPAIREAVSSAEAAEDEAVEASEPEPEYDLEYESEPAGESLGDTEPELTMEQAVNPFDEEFEEEEVVIQQFVPPSEIARGEYDNVTSAYSRHLSAQLSAAHPGLRINAEDEQTAGSPESEFEPLSAMEGYSSSEEPTPLDAEAVEPIETCQEDTGVTSVEAEVPATPFVDEVPAIHEVPPTDENLPDNVESFSDLDQFGEQPQQSVEETLEESFSPADDPVLPEESIMSFMPEKAANDDDTNETLGTEAEPESGSYAVPASAGVDSASNADLALAIQEEMQVEEQIRQLSEMTRPESPSPATPGEADTPDVPETSSGSTKSKVKRKKVFRRLFSGLRRN